MHKHPESNARQLAVRAACLLLLLWPVSAAGGESDLGGQRGVSVMTRNLYFGFGEENVLLAPDFLALVFAVTDAWQSVQDTDFHERAEAIADEIDAARPSLVGLQEAALYRIQSPGDLLAGGDTPATEVAYDFVEILRDALADRGLAYDVAVSQDNLDVELPTIFGDDVRLTDRDVILARTDLPPGYLRLLDTDAGYYDTLLELQVAGEGGPAVTVLRGWVSADVEVRGRAFRFVNTHLESDVAIVQEAQAWELAERLEDAPLPVILLGDFNSDAFGVGTDSYEILLDAGFTDAWTEVHPVAPGLTWGQSPDLLNPVPSLTERLDLILFRGPFGAEDAYTTGDDPADRTQSGLWPSDHAGVAAEFSFTSRRLGQTH